jgi:hypothetical protein
MWLLAPLSRIHPSADATNAAVSSSSDSLSLSGPCVAESPQSIPFPLAVVALFASCLELFLRLRLEPACLASSPLVFRHFDLKCSDGTRRTAVSRCFPSSPLSLL